MGCICEFFSPCGLGTKSVLDIVMVTSFRT